MIAESERKRLLDLAREALTARVTGAMAPRAPEGLVIAACGVFVTVRDGGDLRGCLGTLDARERLAEAVVRLAGDVAHKDPRFEPIEEHEIERLRIDLSVLRAPELVEDASAIIVGRDGVIVEHGPRRGLLLPQVGPEQGWDRETLLANTCLKAGLAADAWRNGAAIFRFEAEVFGEGK